MKLIQQLLLPRAFDTIQCDCGNYDMKTDSRMGFAHVVPFNRGMSLSEAITIYYSEENWETFRGFCDSCNGGEDSCEKELQKNPGILWANGQNLILIKPVLNLSAEAKDTELKTVEQQASDLEKDKLKCIGSNAKISGNEFQCVGFITRDNEGTHSVFIKRLGDWYQITNDKELMIQYYNEPVLTDGIVYLFMRDEKVPHYV
jgi:hypothetical protein